MYNHTLVWIDVVGEYCDEQNLLFKLVFIAYVGRFSQAKMKSIKKTCDEKEGG